MSDKRTNAAELMADHPAEPSQTTVHTEGGTTTFHRPVTDIFDLTELDKKEMGIRDDEAFTWLRRANIWQAHEMSDRFYEFRKGHPGARIPLDKDGNERFNGDTVLTVYPREQQAEREKALLEGAAAYVGEIGNHPGQFRRDDYTVGELHERAMQNRENNVALGITGPGSPTSGVPYLRALSMYSKEQIKEQEQSYRKMAQHVDYTHEDWKKDVAQYAKQARQSVFGMGDTGFPRRPLNIREAGSSGGTARKAANAARGGA